MNIEKASAMKRVQFFLTVMVLYALAGEEAQAFYNPQTGRWLNRDPIHETGSRSLYSVAQNDVVGGIDRLGLYLVTGPTAALFSWIAPFNVTAVDIQDFIDAYESATGEPVSQQVAVGIQVGLNELTTSANPEPGQTFTASHETRGWLEMTPTVSFGGNARVLSYITGEHHDHGYTPIRATPNGPVIRYDVAEGDLRVSDSGAGKQCITITILHRARIGSVGQSLNAILTRTGVPYNWRELTYTLCCNGDYTIVYSASDFPSHRAYLRGRAVATKAQSGLATFWFAGNAVSAPGGSFYTAAGNAYGPNLPGQ